MTDVVPKIEAATTRKLRIWVAEKHAVAALWLFGSRARGTSRDDSDYDFALELMPSNGSHDWSFGDFVACGDQWEIELEAIVTGPVSVIPFRDDLPMKFDPRIDGVKLWDRKEGQPA